MSEEINIESEGVEKFQSELAAAKAELKEMEDKAVSSKDTTNELTKPTEDTIKDSTPEENSQPEYTEVEKEALQQGWDPKKSKSAERFLEDGSFFKKISSQNKKIDDLTDTVKALLDHNKKLEVIKYEEGYKKALTERQTAIEEGDLQAFNVAEEKLKQQHALKLEVQPKQPEIPPEVKEALDDFQSRNKDWFTKTDAESQEMTKLAVAYDQYNLQNGKSAKESVKEVESLIRLKFPHRFENPKQEKVTAVGKSTVSSAPSKDLSSKLTEQQLWVFKQSSRVDPSLKLDDYVRQLKETGALKND